MTQRPILFNNVLPPRILPSFCLSAISEKNHGIREYSIANSHNPFPRPRRIFLGVPNHISPFGTYRAIIQEDYTLLESSLFQKHLHIEASFQSLSRRIPIPPSSRGLQISFQAMGCIEGARAKEIYKRWSRSPLGFSWGGKKLRTKRYGNYLEPI